MLSHLKCGLTLYKIEAGQAVPVFEGTMRQMA